MATRRWTETDYDTLSWHDNHVHGLEIYEGEHGAGDLVLHLDYILEWLPPVEGRYYFVIAPARLHFRDVFGLRFELDYLNATAAMTPFSIGSIAREEVRYPTGHISFRWTITVSWPEGLITFESSGFVQQLTGRELLASEQCLSPEQRDRQRFDRIEAQTEHTPSFVKVQLDGGAITDWNSFHDHSADVFGFPNFYGRNLNAWIDCLTYVREGDGMSRFQLGATTSLLIEVANSELFRQHAPEVFDAFIDCIAVVNHRQIEVNQAPAVHVLFR